MLLRYHDPAGWPMIREALLAIGQSNGCGNSGARSDAPAVNKSGKVMENCTVPNCRKARVTANLLLRVASLRPKEMVPSDRHGDIS